MESWLNKNNVPTTVAKHRETDTFRGLVLSTATATTPNLQQSIITLPRSLTLSTTSASHWDSELATQLLNAVFLGSSSPLSGYVSLLTNGLYGSSSAPPPSLPLDSSGLPLSCSSSPLPQWTSPSSLRHWSASERSYLIECCGPVGERAVKSAIDQLQSWVKISGSDPTGILNTDDIKDNRTLWFVWAMEAVNSRAFRGVGGVKNGRLVAAALIAQGLGLASGCVGVGFDEFSMVAGGGVAFFIGLGVNIFKGLRNPKEVLMLPYIDSANHDAESKNLIQYNPIKREFEFTWGDADSRQDEELFISYGDRSSADLLINFGIIKGGKEGRESDRRIMAEMLAQMQ